MTLPLSPPPAPDIASAGLFLDFDGTLVALAERPDGVIVDTALTTLLVRLGKRLGGRVAIVSGRSLEQLDALIGETAGALALVGSHGIEMRRAGEATLRVERPAAFDAVEAALAGRFAGREGMLIEVKTRGVAVHYRLRPEAGAEALALAEALAAEHGLAVQRGKMMVELREAGHDKGSGIAALMRAAPFAGCTPLFLGDDVTDEAGFAYCAGAGGAGILVGAERESAARYRLPDVPAVRDWLAAL